MLWFQHYKLLLGLLVLCAASSAGSYTFLPPTTTPRIRREDSSTTSSSSGGFQLPLTLVGTTHNENQNQDRNRPHPGGRAKDLAAALGVVFSDTQEFVGNQTFMVTLDTASSDLWVASSDCRDADCQAVPTYNKSSSTLSLTQAPFKVKYVQGSVSGTIGYETVTLGRVRVSKQVLGLVNNVSSVGLADTRNSGILGLSFPISSAVVRGAGKTFLENIYEAFDENSRFFTFRLGRHGSSSLFTIGQVASSIPSTALLSYFPVYPSNAHKRDAYDYWKLPLHHINVNGSPLPFPLSPSRVKGSATPIAVLDTGTSLVLGPVRDVDALWSAVGGGGITRDPQSGLWMIPCDRGISISFVLGGVDGVDGREYSVHPADLSWNETTTTPDGNLCLAGIQGNDKVISGDWLLGDAFLRNVYVTHHAATTKTPPLIGLAQLTDPVTAMSAFRAERGQGNNNTGPIINYVPQAITRPSAVPFLLFSMTAGFASGLVVLLVLKLNACRRITRKKRVVLF